MKSNIQMKLAASLLKGKKMVCKPCCNTERNYYKGIHSGSLHAEANAIISYYGKNIAYDNFRTLFNFYYKIMFKNELFSSKKWNFDPDRSKNE
jgi:hypothetical protein